MRADADLVHRIMYRFLVALVRLAVRSRRSKDLEIIVLRHQLGVLRRQVDRPELTDADRTLLGAIAAALPRPSRAAGHPRHTVALAPAPHRRALDPTTATTGPTVDLSRASQTHTAPRSRESNLGLPPHPRRTERARPPPRCVHGLADPQERRNRPGTHTLGSHLVAVPAVPGRRRLRLRHHRNRHAAQVLPAVLHRHPYPDRVLRRDHGPPHRRVGHPSGTEPVPAPC